MNVGKKRRRLDAELVARGLASDPRQAAGLIVAGKVVVEGKTVTKAGAQVRPTASLHVRGRDSKYVSRGGDKLEHALRTFGLDVVDLEVLDAGASTGGFTHCLLAHGAARVHAADVGHGQLHSILAQDPRVVVLERTNISDLTPEMLVRPPAFCSIDLSYLSLAKAVPILEPLLDPRAEVVGLVKPLYEGLDRAVMDSMPALRRVLQTTVDRLQQAATRNVSGVTASPVPGSRGAIEFLVWLSPRAPATATGIDEAMAEAERVARRLPQP